MHTVSQPRPDPLRASAHAPLLALTVLSLGMSGSTTRCPRRPTPAPRPPAAKVLAPAPIRLRAPVASWLDFIDFRDGSGDLLARLGLQPVSDTRPSEPT